MGADQSVIRRCSACGVELPPGRTHRYCTACKRAYNRTYRRPDGSPCRCGRPRHGKDHRCQDCQRKHRERYLDRQDRCAHCGAPKPISYRHHWCEGCLRAYNTRRRHGAAIAALIAWAEEIGR